MATVVEAPVDLMEAVASLSLQALRGGTFHTEHVVPQSRKGSSALEILALSCPQCNLHKSDRTEGPTLHPAPWFPYFIPELIDGPSTFNGKDSTS